MTAGGPDRVSLVRGVALAAALAVVLMNASACHPGARQTDQATGPCPQELSPASGSTAIPTQSGAGRALWVDIDARGGPCSDARPREEVSPTAPWCTLGRAGIAAMAGDTVHVRGGTYRETFPCEQCNANAVLQVTASGLADDWIRYRAEPREQVQIVPSGPEMQGISIKQPAIGQPRPRFIEISGFQVRGAKKNCVEVKDTADIILRDLEISDCGSGAVELHRTARVTLEASRIHDNRLGGWTSAVDLYECGDGHVVRGNRVWSNRDVDPRRTEGHGLTMDYCKRCGGALVENNVIYDNDGWCMAVFVSDGATIRHNTCWMNGRKLDGSGEISLLGSRHSVENNILVASSGAPALVIRATTKDWPSDWLTISEDHNLIWAPTHDEIVMWRDQGPATLADYRRRNQRGWGEHGLQTDPRFIDPRAGNFRLAPGSPAIDATGKKNAPSIDIDGNARPSDGDGDGTARYDLGAHER